MIVNRRTFSVKQGRMEEATELVAKEIAADKVRGGYSSATRVYTSSIGSFNQLSVEWEYESLAAYERMWDEWFARPTTPAFMEKWMDATTGEGTNEIWDLVE
jgi:hypothetical protein